MYPSFGASVTVTVYSLPQENFVALLPPVENAMLLTVQLASTVAPEVLAEAPATGSTIP